MGTLFNANLKSKELKGLYEELVLQYRDKTEHPAIRRYFVDQIKYEIEEEKKYLLEERKNNCYEHIFVAPCINNIPGLTEFTCVKCGKKITLSEEELWLKDFKQSLSNNFLTTFDPLNGELVLNNKNTFSSNLDIEYYRKLYLDAIKIHNNYPFVIVDIMLEAYEKDKKESKLTFERKKLQ